MATPTERIVIEAARAVVAAWASGQGASHQDDLVAAVDALDTAENANGPREQDLTWGQVVADDEVKSKDGRWYTVRSAETDASGQTHAQLSGVKSFAPKRAGDAVRVRRSEMGQAVDALATVLWSR